MIDVDNTFSISADLADIIWDMSPIVIALLDDDGRFLYVNHMAQHFWEYTEAELKQKKWQDITHPEDLSADLSMHKLLKDKKQQHYTMCKRYITKSGKVVWGNLTVHLTSSTHGNMVCFLSQVVPLDSYVPQNTLDSIIEVQNQKRQFNEENAGIPWGGAGYLKNNWTSVLSLLFVIDGGLYVFSTDLGANKQKITNMEERIKKVEKGIEDVNKKTSNIDSNISGVMKLLQDIKKENEERK